MNDILFFILMFGSYTKGIETECNSSEGTIIICKFGKNINSLRRDFTVYFYSANGHEELLVDCAWINDQLMCIEQEGFKCNHPVSDIAVISVPSRFLNRSGTYRCIDDGSIPKNIKPCRFSEKQGAQQERQQEGKDTRTFTERDYDDKTPEHKTAVIYLSALGIVLLVIFIVFRAKRRNFMLERSKKYES